jgi:threonine dehydrogenase-like Zn-dependent dehydrogenase
VAEKAVNEALRLQQARLGEEAWAAQPPRVLVTGLGPIAFAGVIAATCRGWPTTVLGRDAADSSRAQLVRQFGAEYLTAETARFDSRDPEREGFDLVLECTGSEEVVLRCATVMAACGVMAWLGSSRMPRFGQLNVARFVRDGLVRNHLFLGSVNAALRDFQDAIRHLSSLQREQPHLLAALVTARVGPDDALWHFAHRQPQGIKTVVEYSK